MSLTINVSSFGSLAFFWGAIGIVTVSATTGYAAYCRLLPRPLSEIPSSAEAAKLVWGDILDLRNNSGDMAKWCGKHLIKHGSPISQILRGPFKTPIVLVANLPEAQDLIAKSKFDRSDYIINRSPLFGDFHLNMKTNNKWRVSRAWLKDLLSRQHLYTETGPYIHRIMADLISVWEFKAKASKGMPFSISADLKYVALDVVMAFQFGEDFKDSAVGRQAAYLQRMDLSNLKLGLENQIVEFPSTPLHDFQHGLHMVGDKMGSIYMTKWPPGVVSWWARYVSSYYRKYFVAKDNFIRDYIAKAV